MKYLLLFPSEFSRFDYHLIHDLHTYQRFTRRYTCHYLLGTFTCLRLMQVNSNQVHIHKTLKTLISSFPQIDNTCQLARYLQTMELRYDVCGASWGIKSSHYYCCKDNKTMTIIILKLKGKRNLQKEYKIYFF